MTRTGLGMLALVAALGGAACSDDEGGGFEVETLEVVGGDGQTAAAGTALPNPFVVEVLDGNDNPVEGIELRWTVVTGGGQLGTGVTVTDDEGQSTNTYTLGAEGPQQVRVAVPGFDLDYVFTATIQQGGGGGEQP